MDSKPGVASIGLNPGINLIGLVRAEIGIGESCRVAAKAIKAAKIPFGVIDFTVGNPARMEDLSWFHKEVSEPEYSTNLFVINADLMKLTYLHFGNGYYKDRYNIGYWAWELPDFPDAWYNSFDLIQEVWVPSTFVLDSVSRKSPVPVVRIPHAIEVSCPQNTGGRIVISGEYQDYYEKIRVQGILLLHVKKLMLK